ncbi:MAG TPA: ROK family protein, partial [Chloroflexota bacterium]|nr:ROK family protein [Chloroflexota bacterium]
EAVWRSSPKGKARAPRSAQPELLKDLNRSLVLGIIRRERVFSRAQVARESGLSKVTASAIVDDLLQAALVGERGSGQSNGGRPPQLLEFLPGSRLAIGAQFANHEIVAVVTDLDATIVREVSRPVADSSADNVLATTGDLVVELLETLPRERVLGLGFASPGLVDVNRGVVNLAIDVGWRDVPAARLLAGRLDLPTMVANRSKTAALAERWCWDTSDAEHLIYVSIGSGIAAGVVHGDTLYLGATSSAGELGHVTVDPAGPVCECGNRGCLHVYASEEAIVRRARELARNLPPGPLAERIDGDIRSISVDTVIDAALGGDPLAIQVIEEAGEYVGIALANVVNLFNPDVIVIGGPTSRAGATFLTRICQVVRRRALTVPGRHATIAISRLGKKASAVGGAILVLREAPELIFRSARDLA